MQKIRLKGDTNNTTHTRKQKSTRDLLIEFMAEQRTFNIRIEKEVVNLRSDVSSLNTRIDCLVKANNLKE